VKESLGKMANPSQAASFVRELSSAGLYKRTQGRLVRELTLLAVVVVTIGACYTLAQTWLIEFDNSVRLGLSTVLAVVVCWAAFRIVNFPPFAEFLIAVQAEVQKVNWPSWTELKRATIVVICTMFFLGFVLFVYDIVWYKVLTILGVLQVTS
jgi:preprotein translocase subunit SecE